MGFISNVFNKAKSFIRNSASNVADFGRKVKNGIVSGYNTVKKIPIIGDAVKKAVKLRLPFLGGASLNELGQYGNKGLDVVGDLAKGDFSGAAGKGLQLGQDIENRFFSQ